MPSIFTRKFDRRIYVALSVFLLSLIVGVSFGLYALWPANVETGFEPVQPIAYSHRLHAGELKVDCRYCHSNVERLPDANIPMVAVCMGCHAQIESKDEKGNVKPEIAKLKGYGERKEPIGWVHVHDLADFVYFDHSRHLAAGLWCQRCHGPIETMERVRRQNSLKMSWCLGCHKKPLPKDYPVTDGRTTWARIDCYTCHR